ncbi:DUF6883 domain-containing protein [Methylobacterium haplocladii]|uniref:DUF6883 domain-containing protein n=1 Tax=Methylobacterium haplocladii TaxID=1176176 RepID=A0A512IVD2_9HYPH|nr:DUF6883 domain-containing protein [Methylobacterium haplocladii]GEP01678.1 hypothetical protein MHA02_40650 [Methylobacterium haplocladii]GJD86260.1 hypothetical protein HPGCJGGD_4164 [Methylobacterium haplocladii]GLS61561.1 hypothetical protein GCM10007887_42870 [Methylobacterium haplocladii]
MTGQTDRVGWIIDAPKIARYLLDLSHPIGGPKAKFLLRFGFTPQDPNALVLALVAHAMGNLPGVKKDQPKGPPRIIFEGTVTAPDGRDMPLRTVWEPSDSPPEMRFVTPVPLTRRKTG